MSTLQELTTAAFNAERAYWNALRAEYGKYATDVHWYRVAGDREVTLPTEIQKLYDSYIEANSKAHEAWRQSLSPVK